MMNFLQQKLVTQNYHNYSRHLFALSMSTAAITNTPLNQTQTQTSEVSIQKIENKSNATINAVKRDAFKLDGKNVKSRNRITGEQWITGNLYGKNDDKFAFSQSLCVQRLDVEKLVRKYKDALENTVFDLVVTDQTIENKDKFITDLNAVKTHYKVVPRQLDCHPLTDAPRNINFLRYWKGETKLRIPIKYTNEEDCMDFKKGGYRIDVNKYLECICESDEVPSHIIVDMTDKKIGDVINLKTMQLPYGIRPSKKVNVNSFIASVIKSVAKA